MRDVITDVDLAQARAAVELVRAATAEARCRAALLDGDGVEAHLEYIVLEQTLRALTKLSLASQDDARRVAIQSRFEELSAELDERRRR